MAIGPFISYQLPGVYGPSGTELIRTPKGYAIGWCNMQTWGGPAIEGTPKEIARDLIVRYSNILAIPSIPGYDLNSLFYYNAIRIDWKPELVVTLYESLQIANDIDKQTFIDEMTAELKPLIKLLPFA